LCSILTPALTEELVSLQHNVKQAVECIFPFLIPAQGQGYLFLKRAGSWLDAVHAGALGQGVKVQGLLAEAQKFLNC
jgi:hypothetical protein